MRSITRIPFETLLARRGSRSAYFGGFQIVAVSFIAEFSYRFCCFVFDVKQLLKFKGALAIRRIFSLVDMITKAKFSNCPNVFKIGLFL